MAANARFHQLKRQVEKLRKDSLDLVASANKILYRGVQKLADKELKALNAYYKSAVASIKQADKADIKGAAKEQIDLLQETVNTVIGHARESLAVVAEARNEIAKLVQKGVGGAKVKESQLKKAAAPARKAVKDVKKSAKKAGKSVKKTVASAEKAAAKGEKSVVTAAKKAVKDVRAGAKSAAASLNLAVSKAAPSPESRAGRATSKAKETATSAIETVTSAASNLSQNVSSAVSGAVTAVTDAIKSQ
ncbi:MAG: phasin family protein [Nevskia sp.]|nr:phasin family protein [Nevskia sp.]